MNKTITADSEHEVIELLRKAIDIGVRFKLQEKVFDRHLPPETGKQLVEGFPDEAQSVESLLEEFEEKFLPYCTNYSSPNFMGFPDAGHSVAALAGGVLKEFLQQDLMNQNFCGPSACFAEISVIQWLREIVGYRNIKANSIWDVGGIVTQGGTLSNAVAMMLARENRNPGTMQSGVRDPNEHWIIIPKGIGHYSIKSSMMWIGCGSHFIEVETRDYKYDLDALEKALEEHEGKVMSVVAYAGDSRTMTVDNFTKVHDIVKSFDENIWLHADACHGFSLGFSNDLRHKINGMELFDSITMDPHKVLLTPYTLSVLAVKDPASMKMIATNSSLIIREPFDFGQITPFTGTKQWESLKLWFMMKNYGRQGLDELITRRHELARYLQEKLENDGDFIVINECEINSVAFMYVDGLDTGDIHLINEMNRDIHSIMLEEGSYFLHQFPIPDAGRIDRDTTVYPLRFMCGNPDTSREDVDAMIEYIRSLGQACCHPCDTEKLVS